MALPSLVTVSLPGAGELALAHVHRDLVLLHQAGDALVELLGDAAAARHDLGEVEAGAPARQAVSVGMLHMVKHLGRAQQRLGRDAAPVEADAAEILALDDRGLEPELRRADRRDIAAGARAENDEVVGVQPLLLQSLSPLRERALARLSGVRAVKRGDDRVGNAILVCRGCRCSKSEASETLAFEK